MVKYLLLGIVGIALGLFLAMQPKSGRVAGTPLSIMTYNIGDLERFRPTSQEVSAVITKVGVPDVLLLQEVPGERTAANLAERLGLAHYVYANYKDMRGMGLAIISRRELCNREVLHFTGSPTGRGAILADMDLDGMSVTLVSVHLDHIGAVRRSGDEMAVSLKKALGLLLNELTDDNIRSRSIREMVGWVRARRQDRTVVGGDFNTVPFTKAIRIMNESFRDSLWPTMDFLKGSYLKTTLPILPRIDYIFHSADVQATGGCVHSESLGDHYPVRADLAF
ncbi:MAG: endonuclease/exonuclease/phosphatase family protein [Acidobacteriota bacterium]